MFRYLISLSLEWKAVSGKVDMVMAVVVVVGMGVVVLIVLAQRRILQRLDRMKYASDLLLVYMLLTLVRHRSPANLSA